MSRFNLDDLADLDEDLSSGGSMTYGRTNTSSGGVSSLGLETQSNRPSNLAMERQRRLQQMRAQKRNQRSQMDTVISNSNPMSSPNRPLTSGGGIGRYNQGNTGRVLQYGTGLARENNSGNSESENGGTQKLVVSTGSRRKTESSDDDGELGDDSSMNKQPRWSKSDRSSRKGTGGNTASQDEDAESSGSGGGGQKESKPKSRTNATQLSMFASPNGGGGSGGSGSGNLNNNSSSGSSNGNDGNGSSSYVGGYNNTPKASSKKLQKGSTSSSSSSSSLGSMTSLSLSTMSPGMGPGVGLSSSNQGGQGQQEEDQEVMAMIKRREEYREKEKEAVSESEKDLLAQGIAVTFDPSEGKDSTEEITSFDISDLRSFLLRAAPANSVVRCRIDREKSGKDKLYPKYRLYLEENNTFLLAARKRKKSKSANYLISLDGDDLSRDSGNYVGKLRSNMAGTQFTVYDKGDNYKNSEGGGSSSGALGIRQELGLIKYQKNVMGWNGPRKLTVVLPEIKNDGTRIVVKPTCEEEELQYRDSKEDYDNLRVFRNKEPQWNEATEAYVLNFQGRVSLPSVKNFQLVEVGGDQDYIAMQFGKIGTDTFTLDYRRPLNALQAFAIALSGLDNKLMCE